MCFNCNILSKLSKATNSLLNVVRLFARQNGNMELSVHSTLLPVSVFCTVFGFSTFQFKNKTMRTLKFNYCFIIIVFTFTSTTVSLVTKVSNMEINYVSVTFLVSDSVTILILTYYRVKFNMSRNFTKNILNHLQYVDDCLNSIGVKVNHMKDCVTFWMYFNLTLTIRLTLTYILLLNVAQSSAQGEVSSQFKSIPIATEKVLLYFSVIALETYFVVTLYILKQRLMIFREAFLRFSYLRNVAWSDAHNDICRRLNVAEKHQIFNTLYLIYASLLETYYHIKELYKYLICLELLILTIFPSIHIAFNSMFNYMLDVKLVYILHVIFTFGIQTLPFLLVILVTFEIRNIKGAILNVYYQNSFNQNKTKINNWLRLSVNMDVNFDWKYFAVDYTIFSFAINYFTLFGFTGIN